MYHIHFQYNMVSRGQIPDTINSQKLLKELSKEIRHAERYLISLNPPKPERESKRKKKKPLNKDFVDFDFADKMTDNPFKATLKETNKAEPAVEGPNNRPPLKLTLPKPALYLNERLPAHKRASKPGKQSPTVIRFKLGNNEVVRSTNDSINVYGNVAAHPTMQEQPVKEQPLVWKQTSVYDFHDGSNESDYGRFTIDESQKRKRAPRGANPSKQFKQYKHDYDGNVDILNDTPKNGIEELLKASAYTLGNGAQRIDVAYVYSLATTTTPSTPCRAIFT